MDSDANINTTTNNTTTMMDDRSHPILQQTPLTVNPFLDLPTPPTLPHTYASIPSTLPPSALQSPPATSNPSLPAYITSPTGDFSAHPKTLLDQSTTLLAQLQKQKEQARKEVEEWERGIKERELAEKRRKAPGWLDSEVRVLEPERRREDVPDLMDDPVNEVREEEKEEEEEKKKKENDLGDAMDRAFGRGLGG